MMLDIPNHRTILVRILKDIYTDTTIGPALGFKGGTAAMLFYGLDRFSVDLDFDLLDLSKKQEVFDRIRKILKEFGTIKGSRKIVLSYTENHQKIKVDINPKDFGSRYEVKSYLGIAMKVMVKEDMAANKMVAMVEREYEAKRDIFDTYFFLKNNWPINEKIIEKRTGLSMREFLRKCISGLESMSNNDILSGLGELLDAKQKAWVKNKLRTETIFLLQLKLENISKAPQASLYYKEGENQLDPSDLGARTYKEYKKGGMYNMPISPATATIQFDMHVDKTFLDKFLPILEKKIHQLIKKTGLDKKDITRKIRDLKIVPKGQSVQISVDLDKKELEELVAELNQYFTEQL